MNEEYFTYFFLCNLPWGFVFSSYNTEQQRWGHFKVAYLLSKRGKFSNWIKMRHLYYLRYLRIWAWEDFFFSPLFPHPVFVGSQQLFCCESWRIVYVADLYHQQSIENAEIPFIDLYFKCDKCFPNVSIFLQLCRSVYLIHRQSSEFD